MAFLTEALSAFSSPRDGLSFSPIPSGFRCQLSLPIPDVQAGAFGISNLRMVAALSLSVDDTFRIGLEFGLARKDAPFALTIFILGGGGFIRIASSYAPALGRLDGLVEIGITVSASLAIALGPIKGGVYVYFGITALYESGRGFSFGVLFVLRGEVNLLGIVSACIALMLQAEYNGNEGTLIGRGRLSVSIKICWCFTLEIDTDVTFTLGSPSSPAANSSPAPAALLARANAGNHFLEAPLRPMSSSNPTSSRRARDSRGNARLI